MAVFGPYRGTVAKVVDGDTVHVQLDVGFDLTIYARVRIYGINAPELRTDAGKDARAYARTLFDPDPNVLVTSHDWDKYGGRIDGEIFLVDGRSFADEMILAGHALPWSGHGPKPE